MFRFALLFVFFSLPLSAEGSVQYFEMVAGRDGGISTRAEFRVIGTSTDGHSVDARMVGSARTPLSLFEAGERVNMDLRFQFGFAESPINQGLIVDGVNYGSGTPPHISNLIEPIPGTPLGMDIDPVELLLTGSTYAPPLPAEIDESQSDTVTFSFSYSPLSFQASMEDPYAQAFPRYVDRLFYFGEPGGMGVAKASFAWEPAGQFWELTSVTYTAIPEPSSLLVWSLLLWGGTHRTFRRTLTA